ncbi:MAG: hypothetical protein AUF79_05885 [Crenarchaeota archaeon 13_1_20CM_2_51_8]|nr:MAG: hypothetical protein AUF79_05885 [Crenarchaeota archaeon 13_1_20CM_2_51_8]
MSKIHIYDQVKIAIARQEILAVLLWGIAIASLLAHDLFQGSYPGLIDFGILAGLGLTAGAVIGNLERTLFGFAAAMALGTTLAFILAVLPALTGVVPPPGDETVYLLWFTIIFRAVFPLPVIISLITSLVGAGVGETYL